MCKKLSVTHSHIQTNIIKYVEYMHRAIPSFSFPTTSVLQQHKHSVTVGIISQFPHKHLLKFCKSKIKYRETYVPAQIWEPLDILFFRSVIFIGATWCIRSIFSWFIKVWLYSTIQPIIITTVIIPFEFWRIWYRIRRDLISRISGFEQIREIKNPGTFIFLRKMGVSLIGCVM